MQVQITRTTPIYAPTPKSGVFVQWLVSAPPAGAISFTLERGGGPNGPFETVAQGLTDYHFYDQHVESLTNAVEALGQLSLQRHIYYRVTALSGTESAQATAVVGDQLPRRQYLLRRKIQRDITVGFKVGSGTPWTVLKRRQWGVRCTKCFDKLTKMVTNSKCPVCLGTSYVGGYHDPVNITSRKGVTSVQTTVAPQGKIEVNLLEITMLDYPLVAQDDVFVERNTDRRYVVRHVTRTELRGVPVHQKVTLSELARDSVEYTVPVGAGSIPTYY